MTVLSPLLRARHPVFDLSRLIDVVAVNPGAFSTVRSPGGCARSQRQAAQVNGATRFGESDTADACSAAMVQIDTAFDVHDASLFRHDSLQSWRVYCRETHPKRSAFRQMAGPGVAPDSRGL